MNSKQLAKASHYFARKCESGIGRYLENTPRGALYIFNDGTLWVLDSENGQWVPTKGPGVKDSTIWRFDNGRWLPTKGPRVK